MVLVVVERPDDQQHLFLNHFFLLTNASAEEESAEALLHRYRQRGTAEADFGDCHAAIPPSLSSAPRPKQHYRGHPVHGAAGDHDAFGTNEAELLPSLLAANLMAAGAELLHTSNPCLRQTDPKAGNFTSLLTPSGGKGDCTRPPPRAPPPASWPRQRAHFEKVAGRHE